MNRIHVYIVSLLILLAGCNWLGLRKKEEGKAIARVKDHYLYLHEIDHIFPSNISPEDSAQMARKYIKKWVKERLMLDKAQLNLSKQDKDVSKQIEQYRTSLLIYRYEEELLKQKMDTSVTLSEMRRYYDQDSTTFRLEKNMIKGLYIKIPKNKPRVYRIFKLYKSEEREDIKELEDYCYQNAVSYDYARNEWVYFEEYNQQLPYPVQDPKEYIENHDHIEMQDSVFYYLIKIYDYKLEGMQTPFDLVKDKLKVIILNKRRFEFLDKVENEIYNNAEIHNQFEIY